MSVLRVTVDPCLTMATPDVPEYPRVAQSCELARRTCGQRLARMTGVTGLGSRPGMFLHALYTCLGHPV